MLDPLIKFLKENPSIPIFLWGVLGSMAVELASVIKRWEAGRIPARHKTMLFWLIRSVFACVSGGFAVAYGIDNPIVAIHIGVATPLILSQLAKVNPVSGQTGE